MKKLIKNSLIGLGLLGLPLAACGDDEPTDGCEHGETCGRKEGGEVRLEIVNKPDGTNFARATAMFIESQDVDEYVTPTPNACNFRLQDEFWPFAVSPGRTYADAGNEVTITGPSATDFTMAKGSGKDFLARDHEVLYTDTLPEESDDYVSPNGMFSVQLNGEGVHGELYTDTLFYPGDWSYTGDSAHAPKTFTEGTDALIEWTTEEWSNKPAEGFSDTMLLAFIDTDFGGPIVLCATKFSNGNFTIPSDVYDAVPTDGLFIMGAVSHHKVAIGDREADFLGQNCKIQPYTVAAAQ